VRVQPASLRAGHVLLLAQEKVTKEKGTPAVVHEPAGRKARGRRCWGGFNWVTILFGDFLFR
jgi:hypothetical protein